MLTHKPSDQLDVVPDPVTLAEDHDLVGLQLGHDVIRGSAAVGAQEPDSGIEDLVIARPRRGAYTGK